MEEALVPQIKKCIEKKLDEGFHEFAIFPFGDTGRRVKQILNEIYGIKEAYILDNYLCNYNDQIKNTAFFENVDCNGCCLILASTNQAIYDELKIEAARYFAEDNIAEFPSMLQYVTQIGKYSYGPLCRNHPFIEKIGAFCSFAEGVSVVENHAMNCITTHPMIYYGVDRGVDYSEAKNQNWFFEGVQPQEDKIKRTKRISIGNDVWLGKNVIITNYANIGNGVVAGSGAVITKDIPDYAVVAGVPARIIRYRYLPQEIAALNKIAWWDWTDEEIRQRYDDFYLSASEFIKKYI